MKNFKRMISILTVMLLLMTTVIPSFATTVSAETNWFVNTFDDLSVQTLPTAAGNFGLPSPYNYFHNDKSGSNCAIVYDQDRQSNVFSMSTAKIYRWLDDDINPSISTVDKFVYEMYVKFSSLNDEWWVGFGQEGLARITNNSSGQLVGSEGFKGKIYANTWEKLAIEVDQINNTYSVFLNDVRAIDNAPLPFGYSLNSLTFLCASSDPVYLDNLRAYPGEIVGEIPAPPEPADAVWFNNNFDDLTTQTIPATGGFWSQPAPYNWFNNDCVSSNTDISIVYDQDKGSNVLNLTKKGTALQNESFKVCRYTNDNTAPAMAINNPDLPVFTYEMDIKDTNLGQNWILGFNDHDFVHVRIENNGLIDHANSMGRIFPNVWEHLAIEVNKSINKYNVYLDGVKVIDNQDTPFDMSTQNIDYFSFKSNWNDNHIDSCLLADNFKAYPRAYNGQTNYWIINNNFDDLPVQTLPSTNGNWNLPVPYNYWHNDLSGSDCSIVEDSNHGNVLKLTNNGPLKVYRWLDDNLGIGNSAVTKYVYEMDVKISDFSEGWRIDPFIAFEKQNNGQISGTTSYYAKLKQNQWAHIAIEVDKTARTYNVYLDRIKVMENKALTNGFSNFAFHRDNNSNNPSSLMLDNFIGYSGGYGNAVATPAEPQNALWFENTFDDISTQTFPNTSGFIGLSSPYQNYYNDKDNGGYATSQIVYDSTKGSNVLSITATTGVNYSNPYKLYRFTDDNTGPYSIDTQSIFTYEMDVKVSNEGQIWDFGFLDCGECFSIPGQNTNKVGVYFNINTWQHITFEVDRANNKFTVYKDGTKVLEEYKYIQTTGAFMIKCDKAYPYAASTLCIDNLKAYPGAHRS